ncbi:uncharacterized protein [Primulina huaijiensis]|uniref:uncharacterized protein n=1 Tax=Primulina huaijiensis TaxID=1492673 RepID=UPI003CC701BB
MSKQLPLDLVSNLQDVLSNRKKIGGNDDENESSEPSNRDDDSAHPSSSGNGYDGDVDDESKPVILVTNSDGVESPGLRSLVDSLVRVGLYSVYVCAPQSDKSTSGHALSSKETVEVVSVEVNGAVAYEISGTPADCVSLALSGALFSWSKPLLLISGINKGSSCGHHMFHSGVVAGATEAIMNDVPSISISLNWKKDVSKENDFMDAVTVCLPIINAAIRDIEKGVFVKGFSLSLEIPTSPLENKGFKVTKRSLWRSTFSWKAISAAKSQAASRFMGGPPGLGMQFAQLGRDASAAGAARRLTTQKKDIEVVESVGAAGKSDFKRTVKHFRLEMHDEQLQEESEDMDFKALENGFVVMTPFTVSTHLDSETLTTASDWISSALQAAQ